MRHLIPFETSGLPQVFADVVVLGSGIAGNLAALAASAAGARVVVLTKDSASESNTRWAQGGIAAVLEAGDSVGEHVEDTVGAGDGLCCRAVVASVVSESTDAIRELESRGVVFDRGPGGDLELGREGGHGAHRIVHASGDATGLEIQRALGCAVASAPGVRVVEGAFCVDLLTTGEGCVGVLAEVRGELRAVWAGAVVLATGGAGRLFRESTNPSVTTGDGIAMAWRAGARIRDMEFMQFHPTVLYVPGAPRKLLSEAARGEGAVILDQRGDRFLQTFDVRGELAPRDVVSRAIVAHMAAHGDDHVLLDLRGVPPERVRAHLPGIVETGRDVGIDVTTEPLPIRPAAHYTLGGVVCDLDGRTSLRGLFAAGEVTSSGLHGANRLASNSLLEGVVMGRRAGRAAADWTRRSGGGRAHDLRDSGPGVAGPSLDVPDLVRSVTSLVWRRAGVQRRADGLREAQRDLARWAPMALRRRFGDARGMEAQNLCTLAQLLVEAATLREETRGVHWRSDHPERDDARFRGHFVQEIGRATRFDPWSDAAPGMAW